MAPGVKEIEVLITPSWDCTRDACEGGVCTVCGDFSVDSEWLHL